jgi:hypothetical protein
VDLFIGIVINICLGAVSVILPQHASRLRLMKRLALGRRTRHALSATSLLLQLLTDTLCRAFLIEEQKIVKRVLHDQQKKAKK